MPAPTITIGEITIIPLSDGSFTAPKTELFPGKTDDDWRPYTAFLNDDGQMLFNLGAFLVHDGGEWTLVDTGVGGRGGPGGRLPGEMEQAGITADAIRRVIFTHLHVDHIGWNTVDRDGRPEVLFKNARHIVQRREWEHFTQPTVLAENEAIGTCMQPFEAAGLLDFVDGDATITPSISAIFTPGHTPGHQSLIVRSGGVGAIITGDVTQNQAELPLSEHGPDRASGRQTLVARRVSILRLPGLAGMFEMPPHRRGDFARCGQLGVHDMARTEIKMVWRVIEAEDRLAVRPPIMKTISLPNRIWPRAVHLEQDMKFCLVSELQRDEQQSIEVGNSSMTGPSRHLADGYAWARSSIVHTRKS